VAEKLLYSNKHSAGRKAEYYRSWSRSKSLNCRWARVDFARRAGGPRVEMGEILHSLHGGGVISHFSFGHFCFGNAYL
jgi:hypothetical protein